MNLVKRYCCCTLVLVVLVGAMFSSFGCQIFKSFHEPVYFGTIVFK